MTYRLIQELSSLHKVKLLCRTLSVSTSAYYAFCSGERDGASTVKQLQTERVQEVFWHHKRRYGARRIMEELRQGGFNIGIKRVRTIMKELKIKAIQPRSFVPKTTVVCTSLARSPNLLLDNKNLPCNVKQVVVGDITYLPTTDGSWLYLCVWMDLYSRFIAGWKVDDNMEASIAIDSFQMLVKRRRPAKGMIVHSDGGGQFKSIDFRALLNRKEYRQSMTRPENHYDNAFAESLFSRLKAELLDEYPVFISLKDARAKIFEYIEGYYNVKRRHSSIGYKSPQMFENNL